MQIPKIDYLAVDFEFPPHGEQLSKEFGNEGWQLTSMLPVSTVMEEGGEPVHRIRCYFMRVSAADLPQIMVPKR
jgi:hypothetical protein